MKNFLLLVIAFFAIQIVSAQDATNVSNDRATEINPEYPGGLDGFYKFIVENYKSPKDNFPTGSIYLSFVVNREGTIDRINILKDNGYGTGEEVKRVLGICPKWKSGEQNGKKVSYKYYLTILIKGTTISCLPISEKSLQDDSKESYEIVYNTREIDVKPEFAGGIDEFYKFIFKNYKMPSADNFSGKVYVTFIIEIDGSLTEIKVLRDIGHGTGKEAIRVLELSPKWKPAEQNGQKVRCSYSLPISLKSN